MRRFDLAKLHRRQFLKLVGGASAAVALPSMGFDLGPNPEDLYFDDNLLVPPAVEGEVGRVLVVGAGMAGLTVANALANAGVEVVVLEGRHRLGGRILTEDVGGTPVDLGASWIHTPSGNPIGRFAGSLGLGSLPAGIIEFALTSRLTAFDSTIGPLSPQQFVPAVLGLQVFFQALPALSRELGPGASIDDAIERHLQNLGLTGLLRRHTDFAIRLLVENGESASASDVSLALYGTVGIEYGGTDVFPEGGFARVVDGMGRGLDVRIGETVKAIRVEPGGVSVVTQRRRPRGRGAKGRGKGDRGGRREYKGSHVVVTLPLGVLKKGRVRFDPVLPAWKLDAIDRLGFGNFEKVVMRFSEPFWLGRRGHFVYQAAERKDLPLWLDYMQLCGAPVLTGITGGPFAEAMRRIPQTRIRRRALEILEEVFGGPVPPPTEVHVTGWGRDPFTRGAYSYLGLAAGARETLPQADLAEPVLGRLLFAGEATSSTRWGYTDGAMTTGIREAKRLLQQRAVVLRPLEKHVGRGARAIRGGSAPLA